MIKVCKVGFLIKVIGLIFLTVIFYILYLVLKCVIFLVLLLKFIEEGGFRLLTSMKCVDNEVVFYIDFFNVYFFISCFFLIRVYS